MKALYKRMLPIFVLWMVGCSDDTEMQPSACETGQTMCPDGQCYDLENDNNHCGRCDIICTSDETCKSGVCEPIPIESRCKTPKLICDDQCVDPQTDENYCGDCNTKCKQDQACDGGHCTYQCELPKSECPDGCFDLNNDTKNCQTCGHDCNANLAAGDIPFVCVDGECVKNCSDGELICGGNCTNPKTDKDYCGAKDDCEGANAGKACASGADCKDGECLCGVAGQIACKFGDDLKCASPTANETCGCNEDGAGLACSELPNITNGSCNKNGLCELTCEANYDNCNDDAADGCETSLSTTDNCGTCGHACDTTNTISVVCEESVCKPTCTEESELCDGLCTVLSEDDDNCGWCGHKCTGKSSCHGGFCVIDASECTNDYVENIPIVGVDGIERKINALCINDLDELKAVRDVINNGFSYPSDNQYNAYILMSDIDIGENTEWEPIGNNGEFKDGYFLGNGKKVSGSIKGTGLFGRVENAVLEGWNLQLDIIATRPSNPYDTNDTGALAAKFVDNVALRNTREQGTIGCYNGPCGGIVGHIGGLCNAKLSMVEMNGTIEVERSSNNVGGIAGFAKVDWMDKVKSNVSIVEKSGYPSPTGHALMIGQLYFGEECLTDSSKQFAITDCHAKGSIHYSGEANDFADNSIMGGLIGSLYASHVNLSISNCSAEAQIDMKSLISGLMIASASIYDPAQLEITDSETQGSIDCWANCGGFIGKANSSEENDNERYDRIIIKQSHAKVDVLGSAPEPGEDDEPDKYDNIGGFIGNVSNASIEGCSAEGKVETSVSDHVGGFAGNTIYTDFKDCSSNSDVSGVRNVGGFAGSIEASNISGVISRGHIRGTDNVGGLLGISTLNGFVKDSISYADVEGDFYAGNLLGTLSYSKLLNCASAGNLVCRERNNEYTDYNECGMIGHISGTTEIRQLANYGDITGHQMIGGFIGFISEGPHDIDNIFLTGKTTILKENGIVGVIARIGNSIIHQPEFVYYWDGATINDSIVGECAYAAFMPDVSNIKSFTYDENNIPVLKDGTKVMDVLAPTKKWIEAACELKSGPGAEKAGTYMLPVLKSLGLDICRSEP